MQGSAVYEQVRQEIEAKGSYALSTDESPFFTPMMQGTSLLTNLSAEESKGFGNTPEIVPTIAGFLGVPIRIADQVVGMVALVNRPGGFTQRELSDAETLAGPAALTFHLAHDEEERERVEQQMHQTAKMEAMGRLAGGIAHDFNNLLTVIQGYAEVGLGAAGPDNRIRQCLVEIDEAADRGANLAQQLLAFSRRQHLQPRTVNINTVLLEMSRMLRCLIGENIEVEMDLAEHPRAIRVDPTQLQMLVLNLVINARDAMPEGGKLALETTNAHLDKKGASAHVGISSGDYVRLAVRDTGVGMTDEVKKHLFEPFFTTKDKGKGTGFGLATCYSIVRQGGGCIEVESRPGQGTQFEVYLPCVEEAPVEVHKPDQILTELPRGVETVLLVEDEPIVRTLAAHLLRDHGYNVLVGADGEEALRMVRENSCGTIDLLLTDVVMPRMGGRELVEQLKTVQPSLRKVLFMSGYADSPSPDNGDLQPDANVFLQKPFKPSALVRKVREVLDS
jgi:signal transduction histidine kinase